MDARIPGQPEGKLANTKQKGLSREVESNPELFSCEAESNY